MKKTIVTLLLSLLSLGAFAGSATVTCGSKAKGKVVQLVFEDVKNISEYTTTMTVDKADQPLSWVHAHQTRYGIHLAKVEVGESFFKRSYNFNNLGSDECFDVRGAKQTGPARLTISKSIGVEYSLTCKCKLED